MKRLAPRKSSSRASTLDQRVVGGLVGEVVEGVAAQVRERRPRRRHLEARGPQQQGVQARDRLVARGALRAQRRRATPASRHRARGAGAVEDGPTECLVSPTEWTLPTGGKEPAAAVTERT